MASVVHLHIGMGRCGSSAVQRFFEINRGRLAASAAVYPLAEVLGFTGPEARGGNATGLARALRDKRADGSELMRRLDGTAARIGALAQRRCILSSEYLYSLPRKRFQTLRDRFAAQGIEVTVIVYLREQRSWLMSRYAQAVKSKRWSQSLDAYIEETYRSEGLDYAQRCRDLEAVFGGANLAVRLFDRERLCEGDVRSDIAGILDLDARGYEFGDSDDNSSAGVLELEMMRVLNQLGEGSFNNRNFLRRSRALVKEFGGDDAALHRLVRPELMERARRHYEASNAALKAEFFADLPGDVFRNRIPPDYDMIYADGQIDSRALLILCRYLTEHTDSGRRGEIRKAATAGAAATSVSA